MLLVRKPLDQALDGDPSGDILQRLFQFVDILDSPASGAGAVPWGNLKEHCNAEDVNAYHQKLFIRIIFLSCTYMETTSINLVF